jgi:hypothetical protein
MRSQGLYEGQLRLRWSRLAEDAEAKADLLGLLHNEAEKESQRNPLSQIVSLEDRGQEIEVLTTTMYLATLLGKSVRKAFKGRLAIDHTAREDLVRVYWEGRDGASR